MAEDNETYAVEFFEDDDGKQPAKDFMRELTPTKRRAIGVAINEYLAHLGVNVVETEFGKSLGEGLYEFRLDQNAEEVLRKRGKEARPEKEEEKILLRVFFHPYGRKIILLLSGYDKAEDTSKHRQDGEIAEARKLLRQWHERQKRAAARQR